MTSGDVSLAQQGDWRRIVRKGKVEVGNSGQYAYMGSAKSAAKVKTYFAVADVEAVLKALR